jgi:hypothetical protein
MTDIFSRSTRYGPIATRHIYDRMRKLTIGAEFILERRDWPMPTSLKDSIVTNVRYRDQFEVEELDGGRGWRILRVSDASSV